MTATELPSLYNLAGVAAALAAASSGGVLRHLAETASSGPVALPELARVLSLDPGALERVIAVLQAAGFVDVTTEGAALAPAVLADAPSGRTDIERYERLWSSLPHHLVTGDCLFPKSPSVKARDPSYAPVVGYLAHRHRTPAEVLADALPLARGRILDVGAGSGVWSLALAARTKSATVTAIDGEQVLAVLEAQAQARGLSDRVELRPGDMHHLDVEEGAFECVVLANVVHLEPPERAAPLVARCARALAPGGRLVVVDCLDARTDEEALIRAVYALNLGLRVPGSAVYAEALLRGWLSDAGLRSIERVSLGRAAPLGALVARAEATGDAGGELTR